MRNDRSNNDYELELVEDYSSEEEELSLMEGGGETGFFGQHKAHKSGQREDTDGVDARCCSSRCGIGLLFLSTMVFMFLWLAESPFSHGVLRPRYQGEPCTAWSLTGASQCLPGLKCVAGTCHWGDELEKSEESACPVCVNGTVPVCPPCPTRPPCPPVIPKMVTYFDFNESPNFWTDPGSHGYYRIEHHIPYGACKELCANDYRCTYLNYMGPSQMCCLMSQSYYPSQSMNVTWTTAIKTT